MSSARAHVEINRCTSGRYPSKPLISLGRNRRAAPFFFSGEGETLGVASGVSLGVGDGVSVGVGEGEDDFLRFFDFGEADDSGVSVGLGLGETDGEGWRFFDFGVTEGSGVSFAFGLGDREGVGEGVGSLFFFVVEVVCRFFFGVGVGSKSFWIFVPNDSSSPRPTSLPAHDRTVDEDEPPGKFSHDFTLCSGCQFAKHALFKRMPASRFSSGKFSLGECARQSGSARPSSSVSTPRMVRNCETIGMLPPSRISAGSLLERLCATRAAPLARRRNADRSNTRDRCALGDFHRHPGRQMFFADASSPAHKISSPILIRHEPEGQLGHRVTGDHGLRSCTLITAADAVDLRGRPRPESLERAVTLFAKKSGRAGLLQNFLVAIDRQVCARPSRSQSSSGFTLS